MSRIRKKCLCGIYIKTILISIFCILMIVVIFYKTIKKISKDHVKRSGFQHPSQSVSEIPINAYPDNINFVNVTTVFDTCETFLKNKNTILIVVKSYVGNFDQRDSIRTTWGLVDDDDVRKLSESTGAQIKVVFFVGYQSHVQYLLHLESLAHDDIIQGSFLDIDDNNIFKTIMTYQWITKYCSEAKYICFIDDDFFLNLGNIVNFILSDDDLQKDKNVIYGKLEDRGPPNRSRESNWFIHHREYLHLYYPSYVWGGTILTNRKVIHLLNAAFPYVKHVHKDDVYIGIVANLLGITLKNDHRFALSQHIKPRFMDKYFSSHYYGNQLALIKGWISFKENNFAKKWIKISE